MFAPQIKIPATYMRGGTSKGVFFKLDDLPEAAQPATNYCCGLSAVPILMANIPMVWAAPHPAPARRLF